MPPITTANLASRAGPKYKKEIGFVKEDHVL